MYQEVCWATQLQMVINIRITVIYWYCTQQSWNAIGTSRAMTYKCGIIIMISNTYSYHKHSSFHQCCKEVPWNVLSGRVLKLVNVSILKVITSSQYAKHQFRYQANWQYMHLEMWWKAYHEEDQHAQPAVGDNECSKHRADVKVYLPTSVTNTRILSCTMEQPEISLDDKPWMI